jgi:hypothetical protein
MSACFICGSAEQLGTCFLMTHEEPSAKPKWPVCQTCIRAWYDEPHLDSWESVREASIALRATEVRLT